MRQIELFHWSLLFGIVSCGAIYQWLRFDNGITKGLALLSFFNLYIRYVEYFWDGLHKAIFFALLGISFWFVGIKAEKIWNIGKSNPKAEATT